MGIFFTVLAIEFFGSLPLYWLGLIPGYWLGGVVGEFLSVMIGILRLGLAYFTGFVAGANRDFTNDNSISALKGYATKIAFITLFASISFYLHGYVSFRLKAVDILSDYGISQEAMPETIKLIEKDMSGGYSGFIGYFITSARRDTSISIFDENISIPKSSFATGINWILRILILGFTWFAARKGANEGMLEKAMSIKENRAVSYDAVWEYMTKLLESHN